MHSGGPTHPSPGASEEKLTCQSLKDGREAIVQNPDKLRRKFPVDAAGVGGGRVGGWNHVPGPLRQPSQLLSVSAGTDTSLPVSWAGVAMRALSGQRASGPLKAPCCDGGVAQGKDGGVRRRGSHTQ